ncbi:RagB/SusD family nutrient uptake outer membrane protein [Chitinophaga barathri]|uniref:RagB/SusD family nutrient uptake outer membrane protein n=1 Tax=Chitinophaga barathri TaxID=1647451 RepID=A0A3N4MFL1_9BACT|nr:RagB/SusD family nutrient uptake outer membrane protein [Chitinophaga barathri]RPD42621.1 RagB/SusD family nutrient uptake outer membrane protein [Chitinophaga barathri]
MKKLIIILACLISDICIVSCKKQGEWLDVPRNRDETTLENLNVLQAVLDNTTILNANYPSIGQLGCDHYFLSEQYYNNTLPTERNSYIWSPDIFENRPSLDYTSGYIKISYANIVLDGLKDLEITPGQQADFNNVKGQALFFRSMAYFELASIFCKQYNELTATSDLGLSLKLTSDIHEIKQRSSLKVTYEQIINDLMLAIPLLPLVSKYKTRPSRQAAFALLARIYLNMSDYLKGKEFCDSSFAVNDELLNFNEGIPSLAIEYRFPAFRVGNKEIIFYGEGIGYTGIIPDYNFNQGFVDTILYMSYDEDDLRKRYFFENQGVNQIKFRGTYAGVGFNFCGLGINEIYLTRAECNARLNDISASLKDLNKLLVNRFEQGKYLNYYTDNADSLLFKILAERKKELSFTAQLRWQDLRRLNTDPRFAITIKRKMNGQILTLLPNDLKYVYPIPQDEIDKTGIAQNER